MVLHHFLCQAQCEFCGSMRYFGELPRGTGFPGAAGPFPIAMSTSRFHFLLGVLQGQEPVLIQALLRESPDDRLDEGVPVGIAGRLKSSSIQPLDRDSRDRSAGPSILTGTYDVSVLPCCCQRHQFADSPCGYETSPGMSRSLPCDRLTGLLCPSLPLVPLWLRPSAWRRCACGTAGGPQRMRGSVSDAGWRARCSSGTCRVPWPSAAVPGQGAGCTPCAPGSCSWPVRTPGVAVAWLLVLLGRCCRFPVYSYRAGASGAVSPS